MFRLQMTFLVVICLNSFLSAQYDNLKFENLPSYKGLKGYIVKSIVQDDRGLMWFGTANGLYKYDGIKFKGYLHDPDDPQSISYNWIHSICKDKQGNLWIGTYGGG